MGWAGRHCRACNPLAVVRLLRERYQTISVLTAPFALLPSDMRLSEPQLSEGNATEELEMDSVALRPSQFVLTGYRLLDLSPLLSPPPHTYTLNTERHLKGQKMTRSLEKLIRLRGM